MKSILFVVAAAGITGITMGSIAGSALSDVVFIAISAIGVFEMIKSRMGK